MSKHLPLYKAIISILHLSDDLTGTFYLTKDIATIIDTKVLSDDGLEIDEDSIKKALKGEDEEYSTYLRDLNVGYPGDDIIFVYHSHQLSHNGPRYCAIGRFASEKLAREIPKADIPNGRHSFRNVTINIDDGKKEDLIKYAKKYPKKKKGTSGASSTSKKKTSTSAATSKKKTSTLAAAAGKRKAESSTTVQSQPSSNTTVPPQAPLSAADELLFNAQLLFNAAAAAKKQRTVPPAGVVRTLEELEAAEAAAKEAYLKAAAATLAARAEIARLETDSTTAAAGGAENTAVSIGQPDFKFDGAYLLNYTLGGKAGIVSVEPTKSAIRYDDLVSGLKKESWMNQSKYDLDKHGSKSYLD